MTQPVVRWVLALSGSLPLLAVAAFLLLIWTDPLRFGGGEWLKLEAMLVLIEFLLLHSGAFMAVGPSVCRRRWQEKDVDKSWNQLMKRA